MPDTRLSGAASPRNWGKLCLSEELEDEHIIASSMMSDAGKNHRYGLGPKVGGVG